MSERFNAAYAELQRLEGGLKLHKIPGDRGGLTFGGISQRAWPDWAGWQIIEEEGADSPRLPPLVKEFYRINYWRPVAGDGSYPTAEIATEIFCFGVVAGIGTSVRLAQRVVGSKPDGFIGAQTFTAIVEMEANYPGLFLANFKLARIARYCKIVAADQSQSKFLLGWINRALS